MNRVTKTAVSTLFTILIVASFALAANANPAPKQHAAGPGVPMPLLPSTKDGNFAGSKLIAAGPGVPMPLLPSTKDGNFAGSKLIAAGPGVPMPLLPSTKDGAFTGRIIS